MTPYKVLITTSGIGSRLGDFTKYTNKSLLRIGQKPAISHIIENYPDNTRFVITLGYFGDQVKDFLELSYPDTHFEFVYVDRYEGEGTSLLLSLSYAKDKLQEPFIFHASDTIVTDPIPAPAYNWNAGYKGTGSSSYASFDVLGSQVQVMYEKGNLKPDYLHIGLVGIHDYKTFWKLVDETLIERNYAHSLGDVDVLKKMIYTSEFRFFETRSWYDIGNVDKMNEAKSRFSSDQMHVLDKLGESIFYVNGNVVKFFYNQKVCSDRVERTKYLQGIVPEITDAKPNFYKYGYVQGYLFSNIANRKTFPLLLDWAAEKLWKSTDAITLEKFREVCNDFYFNKTAKRLADFYESRGIVDKTDIINDERVPSVEEMLGKINREQLCSGEPTLFHGDFILDNIICDDQRNFKLIDWRQDFGGELIGGDMYYDLGKLAHNLVVNHEIIDQNLFSIKETRTGIYINIHRLQTLVECEKYLLVWLHANNYDTKKVEILKGIIWLNMSPLHHHPFDLFLYYMGKYTLYQALYK